MKHTSLGCLAWVVVLAAALPCVDAATVDATASAVPTPAQLLTQADRLNSSDHPRFLGILQQLHREESQLTPTQRWHLTFLDAMRWVYAADDAKAIPLLHEVIDHSDDPSLSSRATAQLIQVDFTNRRYEHAYVLANRLLASLPDITDSAARLSALDQIVQMMDGVGQYDLALQYARQMKAEFPSGKGQCWGSLAEVQTMSHADKLDTDSPVYQAAIETCLSGGHVTSANALRLDKASQMVVNGHPDRAIALLHRIAPSIRASGYKFHIASLPVTLAQAYAKQGDDADARHYALAALALMGAKSTNWIVQAADKVLYEVEKRAGHDAAALSYYERYAALDKESTDDAKARALAYQEVRQEVLASKLKLDALGKQNQILQLRQRLAIKAAEAGRLYSMLLLAVIAFISLAVLWLLRSRQRFRRMARHDGLTHAINREHFFVEAELLLRRLRRAKTSVCLIVLDLDHFKRVNDTHGHAAGDEVLRRTVAILRQELRDSDVLGRLGGEEFGILIPACSREQGVEVASRIRNNLAATPMQLDTGITIEVSASFGLAICDVADCSLRQLLIDADAALYRAKDGGRNRVVADDAERRSDAGTAEGARARLGV